MAVGNCCEEVLHSPSLAWLFLPRRPLPVSCNQNQTTQITGEAVGGGGGGAWRWRISSSTDNKEEPMVFFRCTSLKGVTGGHQMGRRLAGWQQRVAVENNPHMVLWQWVDPKLKRNLGRGAQLINIHTCTGRVTCAAKKVLKTFGTSPA